MKCCVCKGRGWILVALDGVPESLAIQRCDECMGYATDDEASQDEEAINELQRAEEAGSVPRVGPRSDR